MAEYLVAVVEKPRTSEVLVSLRDEGVYDDRRHVREYDGARTAIPVTNSPVETAVDSVEAITEPAFRRRDLAEHLAARGWSSAEIAQAPGSWTVLGSVICVDIPPTCPNPMEVGEALLDLHGSADSVLAIDRIEGAHREPVARVIAGDRNTETIHVEAGTQYALDPARVMFAPGNEAERIRMGEGVEPGERVFDMFAGIGYFALPMARAGAQVTAAEINPTAFQYLLENAVLNDVSDRIEAYRADCREVAPELTVDRVVMGYYGKTDAAGNRTNEAHTFFPSAFEALETGGTVHYHEATPEPLLWDQPRDRVTAAARAAGRTATITAEHRIKSHSPGVAHVVLDVALDT